MNFQFSPFFYTFRLLRSDWPAHSEATDHQSGFLITSCPRGQPLRTQGILGTFGEMNALDVSLQENGESTAVNIVFIVRKRYQDGLTFPAERNEAPGTFCIAVVPGRL